MDEAIRIHVLHCGQVQVDAALAFRQKSLNPLAYTGLFRSKKHQILLPVSVYLIEHPKGLVLIDTGWGAQVRGDQRKYLGKIHYQIHKPVLPEGQAVDEQLRRMGIHTRDLTYVFLSHLHSDHVSGVNLVQDAQVILTSEEEWQAARQDRLRYLPHLWSEVNVWTFRMAPSRFGPEHRSLDLFGDNSVHFVHIPGHTPGLVATLIQRRGRFVLLASDCGYAAKSWKQMILPGVVVNKDQYLASLRWVKLMSQTTGCMEVLANHDPTVEPHMIEI